MSDFSPTPSGIFVPKQKEVGVACGYCSTTIWKHQESRGRLFMYDGKPICAKCRILKTSRHADHIRHDKRHYKKDVADRKEYIEEKEIERVAKIAVDSQKHAEKISDTRK